MCQTCNVINAWMSLSMFTFLCPMKDGSPAFRGERERDDRDLSLVLCSHLLSEVWFYPPICRLIILIKIQNSTKLSHLVKTWTKHFLHHWLGSTRGWWGGRVPDPHEHTSWLRSQASWMEKEVRTNTVSLDPESGHRREGAPGISAAEGRGLRPNPNSLSYPLPLLPLSFARSRESKGCPNTRFDWGVGLRGRDTCNKCFRWLFETKRHVNTAQQATMAARSHRVP